MSPDDWRRVERLFERAAGLDPAQQRVLLEGTCGDEPAVRTEVERLLRADHDSGGFLEEAVGGGIELLYGADSDGEHRRIGPYRLLERIGHGGMGEVFLADRADQEYHKQVAIKLVRLAGDHRILERFRRERQILASLEHPNIAHLLDGGTTDDGVPYLVMEYVEGEAIDRYCDRHQLDVRARLALFGTVCEAVQFAHQNLVVHRDLKPGNIFVTADGVVKLLDFGIAKLLETDGSSGIDPDFTLTAERPLTLGYASPEQIVGAPITAASDVYALGCLLHVLLTGERPFNLSGLPRREAERIVLEETPRRPSRVIATQLLDRDATEGAGTDVEVARCRGTRPDALRRRLAGDLDTIVLMALRKSSRRRYATVAALGRDVERHLAGRPVRAHRDSLGYRAAKFVRRNRVALTIAAVVSVVVAMAWVDRARQATALERQRDQSERLAEFLRGIFSSNDPRLSNGETVTVRELLNSSAERLESELAEEPLVLASLSNTIGGIYRELGLYESAQINFSRALALRREHLGVGHPAVAEILDEQGILLWRQGEHQKAAVVLRQALALFENHRPKRPLDVARVSNDLALALLDGDEKEEAERLLQQALAIYQDHGDPAFLAPVLNNLGMVRVDLGKYEEARTLHAEALRLGREAFGTPDPRVAQFLANLGSDAFRLGRYAEAEEHFGVALAMRRKVLGEDHPDLLETMINRAELARIQGDFQRAAARAREVIEFIDGAPKVAIRFRAGVRYTLGLSLRDLGQAGAAEAESVLAEALALYREWKGDDSSDAALSMINLGLFKLERGDDAAAESFFEQAWTILRANHGEKPHRNVARAQGALGLLALRRGETAGAVEWLEKAFRTRVEVFGAEHQWVSMARSRWARALAADGQLDAAATAYHGSISYERAALGTDHQQVATSLLGLTDVLVQQGELEAAALAAEDALRIRRLRHPEESWQVAEAQGVQASVWAKEGDHERARPVIQASAAAIEQYWGPTHSITLRARARLAVFR